MILSSDKVKKLPIGTEVILIREATGEKGHLTVVKSGRKKKLKGRYALLDIQYRKGWHYEKEEE